MGGSDACWAWNSGKWTPLLHLPEEESKGHRKGWRDGAQGWSQLHWVTTVQEKLLFFLTSSGLQDPLPTLHQQTWARDHVLKGGDLKQVTESLVAERHQVWLEAWHKHSVRFTSKKQHLLCI